MEVQRSRCYFFSCEPVMSRGKKKETRAPYVQIQSPEAGLCRCSICACVFNPLPLWRCTILYLRPVRWGHSHPDTTHRHAWPCQSEDWESSAKVFNACIMFHLDPPPPSLSDNSSIQLWAILFTETFAVQNVVTRVVIPDHLFFFTAKNDPFTYHFISHGYYCTISWDSPWSKPTKQVEVLYLTRGGLWEEEEAKSSWEPRKMLRHRT